MDCHPRRHIMSAATKIRHSAPRARKTHEMTVNATGGSYAVSIIVLEMGGIKKENLSDETYLHMLELCLDIATRNALFMRLEMRVVCTDLRA